MNARFTVAALGAAAFVACVAFAAAGGTTQRTGLRGTVWVVNKPLESVAAFDAATGSVRAVIPVGKDPNSVTVAASAAKAYVTNEGSNDVTVISTMTQQVLGTIPVALRPHHVRTSRDGRRVYVSEYNTNKLVVIDTATDRVVQQYTAVDNPAALTHSMWISRDKSTIWATNEVANQLTELDAATGGIRWSLSVGQRPSEVLATPDSRAAYVTVRNENSVRKVDVASRSITAEVSLPNAPDTIQLSPDRTTLAVGLRGTPAQLSVIDTATMTVTKTIDVAEPATVAGHNWMSANGRYSFVAFEGGRSPGVAVIDHTTNTVVTTWSYPGGGRPHGIFYDDPAATEGPAVTIAPGTARVSPTRAVSFRVVCSAAAVGFCHGRLVAAGSRTPFALDAGRTGRVRVVLSRSVAARVATLPKLVVRVEAVVVDQLGNPRTSARAVRLVSQR